MPFADALAAAQRSLIRESAGAMLRFKASRADNLEAIAAIVNTRAKNARLLDREDFIEAGQEDGVEPAVIHAVANSESQGAGFDANGRLIKLNEPHLFSRLSSHAFDRSHPHLSYPNWIPYRKGDPPPAGFDRHPYTYSQDERWGLFAQQAQLHLEAALGAMSVGRFQQVIGSPRPDMGWKLLRYPSARALFDKLALSERDQLEVFRRYFIATGTMWALREKNWQVIARAYNGPGQVEKYAADCADNYRKCVRLYA